MNTSLTPQEAEAKIAQVDQAMQNARTLANNILDRGILTHDRDGLLQSFVHHLERGILRPSQPSHQCAGILRWEKALLNTSEINNI